MKQLLKNINSFIGNRHPIILGLTFLILLVFCINVPLWGNILLGFGSLIQADYISSFPNNIQETEYLRGYVYKVMLYSVMGITEWFTSINEHFTYQKIAKFVYYLICFGISCVFINIGFNDKSRKEKLVLWLSFWILILLSNYRQFMEAEELAVVFTLGHFAFITSKHKWANYTSGLFIFLLFGCKTITILYGGFALLYFLFTEWNDKEKRKIIIISHLVFLIITVLLYFTVLSQEIENIRRAMAYQGSLRMSGLETLQRFTKQYFEFIPAIPLLSIIPLSLYFAYKQSSKTLGLVIMYILLASSAVILQNRFSSPYHYLSFLPVAIFCFYHIKLSKVFIINGLVLGMVLYVVFQNFNKTTYLEYASNRYYSIFFHKQLKDFDAMNAVLKEEGAKEILFVSGDTPPYYIQQKSAYKQCSAMLLYRSTIRPQLRETERYKEFYQSYLDYNGDYILVDRGIIDIEMPYLRELREKIYSQYDEIYKSQYTPKEYDKTDISIYKKRG